MHSLNKIRQKRRFEMFNAKSKNKVLELNSFFGKYIMRFEDKIDKIFTYYDTPNRDLEKSNIVLFKTQIGNTCELNMKTEEISSTVRYSLRTTKKHFTKQIKPHDNILKHKEFLINSFTEMFMSSISFDPEFLMRKLQVAFTIKTRSIEYRSMNLTGLKITYSFDEDIYLNHFNNQIVKSDMLTIYQHSSERTDEDFENLMSKLSRYCKELTETNKSKIVIARTLTVESQLKQEKEKAEKEKLAIQKKNQNKKK